jgi:hypothetical protein
MSDLQRVQEALTAADFRSFAVDYMSIIRENWREADRAYRRSVFFLFLSALLFELVRTAKVGSVLDLGFVKLTNVPVVLVGLPVVFSYFYYESEALSTLSDRYYNFHRLLFLELQRETPNRQLLGDVILPPTITLSLDDWWIQALVRERSISFRMFGIAATPLVLLQHVGPPFFLGYAYWRLFRAYGESNLLLWCSLILSCMFVIAGIVMLTRPSMVEKVEAEP